MANRGSMREKRYEQRGPQSENEYRDRGQMEYEAERERRNRSWSPTEKPEYLSSRHFSDDSRHDSDEGYGYGRSGSGYYGGSRGGYGSGEYGYGESGSARGGGDERGGPRFGYGGQGGSSGPYPESDRDLGYGRSGHDRQEDDIGYGTYAERQYRGSGDISSYLDMDRRSGGHRGKGPKGYSRSDERIREDVSEKLSDDRYIDASNIEVEVTGGEVVLSGSVDDRRAKRRAEDLADSCSGVKDVQNNIRVASRKLQEGNEGEASSPPSSRGASAK